MSSTPICRLASQDALLQRIVRDLSLPTALLDIILWYANDINECLKERISREIRTVSTAMVQPVGDASCMRDLIRISETPGISWAWNKYPSMSPWWKFGTNPTKIQCEIACSDIGLDFSNCRLHPHQRDCFNCLNGRNLYRAGIVIRRPAGWFRSVDYWRCGSSSPDRDGWVAPTQSHPS
jgi:hypothetical protein